MPCQTSNQMAIEEMIILHDEPVADVMAGAYKQVL